MCKISVYCKNVFCFRIKTETASSASVTASTSNDSVRRRSAVKEEEDRGSYRVNLSDQLKDLAGKRI